MRLLSMLCFCLVSFNAAAFCGFYVGKADTELFNEASKVVIVRDEDRTVLTMVNDYQGELNEFAMVVPVPTFLEREQINIGKDADIAHLDAYTAPRMVEYFDENPCDMRRYKALSMSSAPIVEEAMTVQDEAQQLGVTIEAEYTVGEYDIVILSAKESNGLDTWLRTNGYKIPKNAKRVLKSYIKQGTRFFVAKVNLGEQEKTGLSTLRPLQIAFESPKFMLPIRLGTVNAKDMQELFVFTLTRTGRVETSNYRTVKVPSDVDVPIYVQDQFEDFYSDVFETSWQREKGKAVFLEYAWDMNWCDPCAADPLSNEQLRRLGVFWLQPEPKRGEYRAMRFNPQAKDVFVTRMHLRYNGELFPEDLMLHHTKDRKNFQARYVTRHPWKGDDQCEAAKDYRWQLTKRYEKEAQTLSNLTGWSIDDIRKTMGENGQPVEPVKPVKKWWLDLWS